MMDGVKKRAFGSGSSVGEDGTGSAGRGLTLKIRYRSPAKTGKENNAIMLTERNTSVAGGDTVAAASPPAEKIPTTDVALMIKCGIMEETMEPVRCTRTQNRMPTQKA